MLKSDDSCILNPKSEIANWTGSNLSFQNFGFEMGFWPISILFLPPKAAHIIDEVPNLLGSDPRFAVEARHGRAQAVADIHENLSIGGSMIPFIIGQIRSLGFSCRGELFRFLAITAAGRAVAVRAQAIVKPLARR